MKPLALVKIGGRAAETETLTHLAQEMRDLKNEFLFILVHGGGAEVSRVSEIFGYAPAFVDGVRITSGPEMAVVDMVLSGKINKDITRIFRGRGLNALGLSGSDGGLFTGRALNPATHTGKITAVNPELILLLLGSGYLPVLCSTSMEETENPEVDLAPGIPPSPAPGLAPRALNINADEAALAVAESLKAEYLIFISDIPGILKGKEVLSALNGSAAEAEIASGVISGGMIPKVRSSIRALEAGVGTVIIGEYADSDGLAALLKGSLGTRIIK
jgi:acetylglutamate kinase